MEQTKNKGGRPKLTLAEWVAKGKVMSQKLEPYLKTGLTIDKALFEAKINKAEFYRVMEQDEGFRDLINGFRNFIPVLVNNIITGELMAISARQQGTKDKKGNVKLNKMSKEDKDFIWKFALNSNITKGEFGERKHIDLFDPEAEIQKVKGIIDESSSEEINHDDE